MDPSLSPLDAFLDHGFIPFAGRADAVNRIVAFWESIPVSDELRLLLVSGEAGVGKTRLLDGAATIVASRGGVVIRVRFMPVASSGPIAVVGRAIALDEALRPLLAGHALTEAGDVVAAVARLSRLRATILVLDDIHLLSATAPAELLTLLDSLSQESLAVVALARPVEGSHRDVLERFLVDQVVIDGLSPAEIGEVWQGIFEHAPDPTVIDTLHAATGGNPLSLRSVLRGALSSGAIVPRGDRHVLAVDSDRFVNGARHDLARLAEGMAAHLDPAEREAAKLLAPLGEVFARETAERLLGADGAELVQRLVRRGVIATSNTQPVPIPGLQRDIPDRPASKHPPIAFAHSLVHQFLLRDPDRAVERVVDVIAGGMPLYSTTSMMVVDESLETLPSLDRDVARRLHDRIRFAAIDTLDFDPAQLRPLLATARRIAEHCGGEWTRSERAEVEFGLLATELAALSHEDRWDVYDAVADKLLTMTQNPSSEREASMRVGAIGKKNIARLSDAASRRAVWAEIEELVTRFPGVARSHNYAMMLTALAIVAGFANDPEFAHDVERRLSAIDGMWPDDPASRFLHRRVDPGLLMVFQNPAELEQRRRLFERLEAESYDRGERVVFIEKGLQFLDLIGDVDRLAQFADRSLAFLHPDLNPHQFAVARLARIKWMGALGTPVDDLLTAGVEIVDDMPAEDRPAGRGYLYSSIVMVALLRDDQLAARTILDGQPDGLDLLRPSVRLLAEMEEEAPSRLHGALYVDDDPLVTEALQHLLKLASTGSDSLVEAARGVHVLAERGTLALPDALLHRLVVRILANSACEGIRDVVHDAMCSWTATTIEWLSARRLGEYLRAALNACHEWLEPAALKKEMGRAAGIIRERSVELAERYGRGTLTVRMVGTIRVVDDTMREKKSGGRMKTLLGLMAGMELDAKPMDHRDFCVLAAGDDDMDRARNVVYVTLHRLREALGPDAIITETDVAPRFNLTTVRVDVVEAHRAIVDGTKALRSGNIINAMTMVVRALDILHGDVPFPGLYDEYFEAARDRIETSMRDLVVRLVKRLVAERDFEQSEALLRRALDAMPEDEELQELIVESSTMGKAR